MVRPDENLGRSGEPLWERGVLGRRGAGLGWPDWPDWPDRPVPPRIGLRRRLARRLARRRPRLWSTIQEVRCKVPADFRHFYGWDSTADFLLGLAATSVLANTSLDQDFQDWYCDNVRSGDPGDFGAVWHRAGDGWYIVPAFGATMAVGRIWDHTPTGRVLSDLGCRTERAYLVGTPTLLFFQIVLGGARPYESKHESRWRPFDEAHGVSGHAFIGAVPFISAAHMTDDPYLKAGLYACSVLPAWSRVDQNGHYLSQCWLGWWLAYLACRAVDDTEREYEHVTIAPVATPEMNGIGFVYEW